MRTLYFDCFSGASGDMILGALIDLGLDPSALSREVERLGAGGFRIESSRVDRSGISAVKADVVVGDMIEGPHGVVRPYEQEPHGAHDHDHEAPHGQHHHPHHGGHGPSRSLAEILDLIRRSNLSDSVRTRAARVFERLGQAEARIHGTTLEAVHFHEVGAVDAIVDVVGACAGVEMLGVERFICSPINVGGGQVAFSHGTYPAPAPATAELLRGVPIYSGDVKRELVTPTGAALITTFAQEYGSLNGFRLERVGYGAGAMNIPGYPNVVRLLLGETEARLQADRICVIEAAVDDITAEALGYFVERALAEGALDVYLAPVHMKKNRPGVEITLLCDREKLEAMVRLVFRETTTIGLRHRETARRVLAREHVTVDTPAGPIRVKVAKMEGEIVNAAPEYDDCREAALRTGRSLREVQAMASAAYRAATEVQ